MINHYQELDDILSSYQEARKYALEHAEHFANLPSDRTVYSTPASFFMGIHTPTLLLKIGYSNSFVKGRKLKSPNDRSEYMSYEYDKQGNLIRISFHQPSYTGFSCIFPLNGFQWFVPVEKYKDRYIEHYKAEIVRYDDQGRVAIFAMIDTAQIWLEKYTYFEDDPNKVICEQWNYIPKLAHSDKSKSISETGSPASLWIYQLDLGNPKKITGELIESYTKDVSAYRAKPPQLPAPQVVYKKNP